MASGTLAGVLWKIAEYYRSDDPLAEEVALSLLTSDLEAIGINEDLSGWRAEFLSKIAYPLEEFNSFLKDGDEIVHGYHIGTLVAMGAEVDLPPLPASGKPDGTWRSPLMSEVLMNILKLSDSI